ncbi:MAG: hypothetical protein FAF03_05860 [Epsilonproteobacteria bacterium]|nr:hypothetical protein [Campylobacterota bacterium]
MKKNFATSALVLSLLTTGIYADALKNSLINFMNTKEKSSVVDLGNINLNAKPKPKKPIIKHYKATAAIATVNGHNIIKKDANAYLAQRTQGKIKDFDMIPPKQQQRLIQEMAFPIMVLNAAQKELTAEEIQSVYNRTWMKKEARKVDIKDDEVREIYNQIKQKAADNNNTQPVPPFEAIKGRLKSQMLEKRLIGKLMENVKIEVAQ